MGERRARYHPPWADMSIIGIAGCSGSGKSSVAREIIKALNLPWVSILVMDSFYKPLTPDQVAIAHNNEYDFDSPGALDFDLLVTVLQELKAGKKVDIPSYSFERHQREATSTPLYSPHVLILEGILAFCDTRVADMMDVKIFVEADMDVCLGRRILRDVQHRGRAVDGVIKQWFTFIKPSYIRYVQPQRGISDIIIPRGKENRTAIDLVVRHIQRTLREKSLAHELALRKLDQLSETEPFSSNTFIMERSPQYMDMNTILRNPETEQVKFVSYFDRLASFLIKRALDSRLFVTQPVMAPQELECQSLVASGVTSAVAIMTGGSCLENALKQMIPDCLTGRILIQTNDIREPELHYLKLPPGIETHSNILLLDPQIASGGAALMAVRVLVDHEVDENRIIFVTLTAGRRGLKRLTAVYPGVRVIVGRVEEVVEDRWMEKRYFGI